MANSFTPINQWLDFVAEHNDLKHYVSVAARPGNLTLLSLVEYSLFPPRTKANENFHIHVMEWKGEFWNIFSTPRDCHDDIVRAGKSLAMRITDNPPIMVSLGETAITMSVPTTAREAQIKRVLRESGVAPALIHQLSGWETFPCEAQATHAVENDRYLLTVPLKPQEEAQMRQRELAVCDAMARGARPSARDVADYVYGAGRVLATPRPPG